MKKNKKNEVTQIEQAVANKSNRFLFLLIGFLTFIVFANTISNDYNMDDELVTRNHPLTSQGLKAIGEIFTSPYYKDDMGYAYGYRPIVHLSFALEHELFGEQASISHFINVLLYVGCVLLFLHLLLKWVDEKNKWIAIISVLFFALHPIHTEVVASIKNRDELLAFLFALLAALEMIKFIEKGKWLSLLWIVFYFSLGMLSKKSIFSLTIILPISAILIHSISWKKLVYIVFAFSVPTAIISSESTISKFSLFLIIPWLGSFFFYYFKEKLFSDKSFIKSITDDFYFWAVITLLFGFYGLYNVNYFVIPLIILFSFFCIYIDFKKGIILLSLIMAIIGLRFDYIEFTYFGFVVITYHFYSLFISKQKIDFFIFIALALNISTLFFLNPVFDQFTGVFAIFLFIWLLKKKTYLGIFFSLFMLVISYSFSKVINNYSLVIFSFSILVLITENLKKNKLIKIIPYLSVISVFIAINDSTVFMNNNFSDLTQVEKKDTNSTQSLLQEGRHLEYVENTLVARHSLPETIGTGLSTIGEYAKLMVFPYELSFYYGFSKTKTNGIGNLNVWFSIFFNFSLIFLAIWQLKNRPIISIGIGWYLLSILLFSNWFELVAGMVGERLAFTASAGFSIFIGSLLVWLKPDFSFKKPSYVEVGFLTILLLFSVKSISRNSEWENSLTLMGNDIKHLQNSAQANNLYAHNLLRSSFQETDVMLKQQKTKTAQFHFEEATKIYPKFFNAQFDLARVSLSLGDTSKAVIHFNNTIKLDKTFPDPYLNLVQIYNAKREWKTYLKIAIKLYEIYDSPEASIILAKGYLENNNIEKSKEILIKGLKRFPENEDIKFCLNDLN